MKNQPNKKNKANKEVKVNKPKKSREKTPAMIENPGGRPSNFDSAAPKILESIRNGNTYECAAGAARVSYYSFNNWMKQGKEAEKLEDFENKFFKFFKAVEEAESDAEKEVVKYWRDCIPGNWQAAKEFLARRNPDKWGSKDRVEMNQNVEISQKCILEIPDNGRRKVE